MAVDGHDGPARAPQHPTASTAASADEAGVTDRANHVHDIVVVGGGPGGYAVAFRAAARGLDVALVEDDLVGGTCLNRGCIPSKALLHVADTMLAIQDGARMGIQAQVGPLDGAALDDFRAGVVDQLRAGLLGLIRTRTTFHVGRGRLVEAGPTKVVAVQGHDGDETMVAGRHVVVATGSRPMSLPGVEVDGEVVQTSDQALWFTSPPRRAVIIGAGAIGMEFASMWSAMGSEVTVVEAMDRVLPLEDPDSSRMVERAFRSRGIDVRVGARVTSVDVADGEAATTLDDGDVLASDVVLVAVGRAPATEDIGLDGLDVLDDRGHVATDDFGQTTTAGLWAVGDVRPTLALAHAAFAEGFVVADVIAGEEYVEPVDHHAIPRVTYCTPEVSSVGLDEPAARARHGEAVQVTTYSLRGNAKAIIAGSDGMVKVVAREGPLGEVLGVHVVGPHATELIGETTMAVRWQALPEEVAALTHAHPTLYEAVGEAFMAAAGVPFHTH